MLVAVVAACDHHTTPACTGLCVSPSLSTLDLVAGQPGGNGSVDGIGAAVHFSDPWTFAGDGAGRVYLVDGSIIRAIDEASSTVTTLAGSYGVVGALDGVGAAAQFYQPGGITFYAGTIYVCDTENHAIRTLDLASARSRPMPARSGSRGRTTATSRPPASASPRAWSATAPATCTSPTSTTTPSAPSRSRRAR